MMVADICSQGAQFADMAKEFRELMKRNINTIRQTRFVREISRHLEASSELGCFATMMIGTYFSPTRTLSLCSTGHPPPLLFRAAEQEWSIFRKQPEGSPESSGLLGVVDGVVTIDEYQHFQTKLQPGDMVMSYSDALTECQTSAGHTLGVHGLLDRVRSLDSHEPDQLLTRLVQQIQSEDPVNLALDDATVLLCQATTTSVPWLDNLLAPLRYLQGAADKTTID
jgi:serine phosphatase RsbU (regulator of sigma subunit)